MRSMLATIFAALALVLEAGSISVPTGKKTPIEPAKPTPRPVYPRISRAPIPVVEYSYDNPEPAPIDPSYVPYTFKYIQGLVPNAVYYVPIRVRNYNYKPVQSEPNDNNVNEEEQPVVAPREPDYTRPTKRPVQYYNGAKYNAKPLYYLPKGTPTDRVPTKGGYPKKATARTTNNKYFYYVNQN
uniref:Uncharacterized protein n=1 Tax=Pristhesancus plagipennis TaxID=1955184 RepID=A0A2K8JMI1_PRIPG|nr:secreted hypothetical protein [Pristhesancus plagipennis]